MFPNLFETDLTDYQGTLQAAAFEGVGPIFPPSNIVRRDQPWGIKVDWEVHGPLVNYFDAEFRIRVYLESMGPGTEYELPIEIVATLDPLFPPVAGQRIYTKNINIAAGTIDVGVYKIATVIHVFERSSGNPTPIAGFVEGGMVFVFDPA